MQRKSMRAQSAARGITFTLAALMSQASSLTPKPRVVVVGGGVGGLATAGRLQRLGAECTVLEKNEKLGGRVGEHRWEGHRWETGASLLLLPDVYRRALEAAGGAMVDAVRVDPAYAVWFREHADRGPVVLGGGDRGALRARLELEAPGAFERFERYGACAREYLRAGWPIFIEEDLSFNGLATLPRFLANALSDLWRWPLFGHDAQLRRLFPESARLRALCSFDDLYVGLSPYEAPAVFSLLAAIELDDAGVVDDPPRRDVGVYYPRGGFGTVVDALTRACEASGVALRTRAAVDQVLVADGRATGVRLQSGETLDADYVVVNGDLATTEPALLSETTGAARSAYERERYSTSSITFLWALDAELPQLRHHNVFLAEAGNSDDPFRVAWDDQLPERGRRSRFPGRGFHFYLCAPSRTDASAAPEGRDTLMVLVPTPPLAEDGSDPVDDWIAAARDGVFAALRESAGCGDVAGHVVHERVIDPREWRDGLGLRRGSVFGLAHGLDQLAIFRPSRRSSRVGGLAFVGASTRPGNGVPLVLTSAKLLCAEVADELGLGGG